MVSGLARIRSLLGVAAAQLKTPTTFGTVPYLQSGKDFVLSGPALSFESRAWTSRAPLVLADTAMHESLARDQPRFPDGRPIRFLATLPLALGDHSPVHLLTLADIMPRSIGVANRLAAFALESFHPTRRDEVETLVALHLQQNAALLDCATAAAGIGVWQCNLTNNALAWSAGVYDLFGLERGSPVKRDRIVTQYADASRDEMKEARARVIETGTEFKLDAEIVRPDGQQRWMRLTASVQSVNGFALRLFGTKQDITEERRLIDHMRHLAETDAMTGLANRARLKARLDYPEGISALLLVDLDGFKAVNDTYGHAIGDKCLEEAAHRLRACCTGAPLVVRLGGDEFAIILEADHSGREADLLASRIVECMSLPFEHAGMCIALGASVGLAFRTGGSGEELFRQADQALYVAKAEGRRTSRTFHRSVERSGARSSADVRPGGAALPKALAPSL
jgi:diguanylate cyclase (GGDEF)-like protein